MTDIRGKRRSGIAKKIQAIANKIGKKITIIMSVGVELLVQISLYKGKSCMALQTPVLSSSSLQLRLNEDDENI